MIKLYQVYLFKFLFSMIRLLMYNKMKEKTELGKRDFQNSLFDNWKF